MTTPFPIGDFKRAEPTFSDEQAEAFQADPETAQQFENYLARLAREELLIFTNGEYTVTVDEITPESWPPMWHLSIKRNDKQPMHDWRALQEIKNAIAGTLLVRATIMVPELGLSYADGRECEAVELYPRESRLVDEANQYHLYCMQHPRLGFPFGSMERLVATPERAALVGAVQRPFGPPQPGFLSVDRASRRRIRRAAQR